MQMRILDASDTDLEQAAAILRRGGLVAFPTDTVFGLGANARDRHAVACLAAAKERPADKPFSLLLPDPATARKIAVFSPQAESLAAAFWPGALTLILPLRAKAPVAARVTAGRTSIGLRIPAHPVALALLARFGAPLAVPSANVSGRPSPADAAAAAAGLADRADRIGALISAPPAPAGTESTIIDLSADPPRLLRRGAIAQDRIEARLERPLTR